MAIVSVWNGVKCSMGGSKATGFSSPNDSTCSGLSTVNSRSETSGCDSSIVLRIRSSSGRRINQSGLVVFRRRRQERTEFLFVEGLVVGFIGRYAFHSQVIHDGVVEWLIAEFLADLDHTGDLVCLA